MSVTGHGHDPGWTTHFVFEENVVTDAASGGAFHEWGARLDYLTFINNEAHNDVLSGPPGMGFQSPIPHIYGIGNNFPEGSMDLIESGDPTDPENSAFKEGRVEIYTNGISTGVLNVEQGQEVSFTFEWMDPDNIEEQHIMWDLGAGPVVATNATVGAEKIESSVQEMCQIHRKEAPNTRIFAPGPMM